MSKPCGRCCKFLWLFQKSWTLKAVNPFPTGHGRNQPIYERHVTKSGRNRVNEITSPVLNPQSRLSRYNLAFYPILNNSFWLVQRLNWFDKISEFEITMSSTLSEQSLNLMIFSSVFHCIEDGKLKNILWKWDMCSSPKVCWIQSYAIKSPP